MSRSMLSIALLLVAVIAVSAQSKQPRTEIVSGTLVDLTCAAKGKAMMGKWVNAKSDAHMTTEGRKPGCATLCLKGGQPAALFDGDKVTAVFACNPRATLADYAAQDVDVRGFWAGGESDQARSFVPQKIRKSGESNWQDVDCATMH